MDGRVVCVMGDFSLFGNSGGEEKMSAKERREKANRALLGGDYAGALKLFKQCHAESPADLRIYAKVAELKEKIGDVQGAIADYIKISNAYAANGYEAQAVAVENLILRLDPDHKSVHESLHEFNEDDFDALHAASTQRLFAPAFIDKVQTALSRMSLLSGLPADHLGSLVDAMQLQSFEAGAHIYRVGDPGEKLYLLAMGQVQLQVTDVQGKKKVFAELNAGNFFGERVLLSHNAHDNDAVAADECTILAVDRATFDSWVMQAPEILNTVETFYRQRVLLRLLAMTPVFDEAVHEDARIALADKFMLRNFEDGELILREGEEGETFYLIRSGKVELIVSGPGGDLDLHIHMGEGEFFGEVALLTGRPRTATIHARGSVELMELSRADFNLIADKYPHVREVVKEYLQMRAKVTIDALRQRRME